MSIFELRDVSFRYPDGTDALKNISVSLEKGEKIALLGPNGAGKSTLLLHLIGILKPNQGYLYFNSDQVKYNRSALTPLRSKVGMVFQDPDTQLFSASVWQEVSFGPVNLGLAPEIVKQRVIKALEDTGTWELKDKATHFLSYGQKKLVSIAGILAMEPEVIVFDEPTASLDPGFSQHVMELLEKINSQGITVIMSTHAVDLAYAWADTLLVMKAGAIAAKGNPIEIFSDETLINDTNLTVPSVLKLFQELQNNSYLSLPNPPPRNMKELLNLIRNNRPKLIGEK